MASNKTVLYVDFGITSSKEFYDETVIPAYERFKARPNRANAIDVSLHAWHVHEWIWHEHHPGEDTHGNSKYKVFKTACIDDCPELAWLCDVADAGKHRGLGRPTVKVRRLASGNRRIGGGYGSGPYGLGPLGAGYRTGTPLSITLADGSTHSFAEILSRVMDYWKNNHFL